MKKVFVLALVLAMAVSAVYAQQETSVPPLINYQGRLTDAEGKGLTGTRKIEFNIYDAATGGIKKWGPQTFMSVPLVNGMFNVILSIADDGITPVTNAFDAKERYIGVTVDGKAIMPRQQVLSTPFAVKAEQAAKANIAETVQGTAVYVTNDGNVGIGTTTPSKKLEIKGTLGFAGGKGPFCIFANECPDGWVDKGFGGYIYYSSKGANCPYTLGGTTQHRGIGLGVIPKFVVPNNLTGMSQTMIFR